MTKPLPFLYDVVIPEWWGCPRRVLFTDLPYREAVAKAQHYRGHGPSVYIVNKATGINARVVCHGTSPPRNWFGLCPRSSKVWSIRVKYYPGFEGREEGKLEE